MQASAIPLRRRVADYVDLAKPRITFLMLMTTLAGLWLAARGLPSLELTLFTLMGTGLACASAGIFNNLLDREIDARMERTRERPLPAGRLKPSEALVFGVALGMASLVILAAFVHFLSALLALLGILFYAGVYTAWLKRTTPLCTVLGGVSGALPPVIGWTAVTNQIELESLVLFMILFLWQPPHFWALALLRQEEYRQAGLPMLPVVHGPRRTHRQILLYATALLPISLLLYALGMVSPGYLWTALILGLGFIALAVGLLFGFREGRLTQPLFLYSIFYLGALSLAMLLSVRA